MQHHSPLSLTPCAALSCGAAIPRAQADGALSRIPAPGGEVIFANPGEREEMYDKLTYSAARRTGDFVFSYGVALIAVKSEFMKPPYSTWTAVCIDRHYSDNTVVEIKVTAFAPKARP
jgi:hypothetical protein